MPHLVNKESGTVFGSVNRNDINGLAIKIPDSFKEQRRIARMLAVFDEKIENNEAINENLARDSASPKGREIFSERAKPAPPRAHSAGEAAGFSRRTNAMIHVRVNSVKRVFCLFKGRVSRRRVRRT